MAPPKGSTPWNKGLKGYLPSGRSLFPKGNVPWNKNTKGVMIAWNKGLTKADHPSVGRQGSRPGEKRPNRSGPNHPSWTGKSSENKLIRSSIEYKEWRRQVFERDDYTCHICGIKGGNLNANHIKKFADYPDLRFDPTNGITLCEWCHYKQVNNHEEEWESYFNFNLMTRGIISDSYSVLQSYVMHGAGQSGR